MSVELGLSKQTHEKYSKKQGDNLYFPNTQAIIPWTKSQGWGCSLVGGVLTDMREELLYPHTTQTCLWMPTISHLEGGHKKTRSSGSSSATFQAQDHSGLHDTQFLEINKWKFTLVTCEGVTVRVLTTPLAHIHILIQYSFFFANFMYLKTFWYCLKFSKIIYSLPVDTATEEKT